jgi:citrate lyase subunit beta/citryl-CoA lyase
MSDSAAHGQVRAMRSLLYVPGDQPDKIDNALGRGADGVIFDLEDAVRYEEKPLARATVSDWLMHNPNHDSAVWVRVNASDDLLDADLDAVVHRGLAGIYVPKVSAALDIEKVAKRLDDLERREGMDSGTVRIAALLETADGILDARQIATSPRMSHLSVGEADLAAELGMHPSPDGHEMNPIRMSLVLASTAAGLNPPIGPVLTTLNDLAMLEATSLSLFRMGYGGRTAVHPNQLPIINVAFSPTNRDIERATAIIRRFDEASSDGIAVTVDIDGSLIDEAIVRRARRTIATHERSNDGN